MQLDLTTDWTTHWTAFVWTGSHTGLPDIPNFMGGLKQGLKNGPVRYISVDQFATGPDHTLDRPICHWTRWSSCKLVHCNGTVHFEALVFYPPRKFGILGGPVFGPVQKKVVQSRKMWTSPWSGPVANWSTVMDRTIPFINPCF